MYWGQVVQKLPARVSQNWGIRVAHGILMRQAGEGAKIMMVLLTLQEKSNIESYSEPVCSETVCWKPLYFYCVNAKSSFLFLLANVLLVSYFSC